MLFLSLFFISSSTLAQVNAGTDQVACQAFTTLNATAAQNGVGEWSVVSGQGAIQNHTLYNTEVTNLGLGENIFVWSVNNVQDAVTVSYEEVIADFTAFPSVSVWDSETPINIGNQCLETVGSTFEWTYGDDENFTESEFDSYHTHSYDNWGEYSISLTVTGPLGCTAEYSQEVTLTNPSGIESNESNNLKIFPNPSDGIFYIKGDYPTSIIVSDIAGKEILNLRKTTQESISNFSINKPGVYFIKVQTTDKTYTDKIIVK